MAAALPLMKAVWPYLREYVLDGKGVKESWASNKKRVVLLCLFIVMIGIIGIGFTHIQDLTKEIKTLNDSYEGRVYRNLKMELDDLREERKDLLEKLGLQDKNPTKEVYEKNLIFNEGDPVPVKPAQPAPVPPKKPIDPPPVIVIPNREEIDRVKNYQDFLDGLNY